MCDSRQDRRRTEANVDELDPGVDDEYDLDDDLDDDSDDDADDDADDDDDNDGDDDDDGDEEGEGEEVEVAAVEEEDADNDDDVNGVGVNGDALSFDANSDSSCTESSECANKEEERVSNIVQPHTEEYIDRVSFSVNRRHSSFDPIGKDAATPAASLPSSRAINQQSLRRSVGPTGISDDLPLHTSIESIINKPIRLRSRRIDVREASKTTDLIDGGATTPMANCSQSMRLDRSTLYDQFRCAAAKLNLLNIDQKWDSVHCVPDVLQSLAASDPHEHLRRKRGQVCLLFDAFDEETRVDERHPLLPLQVALLREWCMLNLIDAHDIDRLFSS